jgi:ribosomal-protein-alanine N-acetyltransferase
MELKRVRIRRATETDIERIVEIEKASFPDPWDISAFFDSLRIFPAMFFVAESGGQISGFISSGIEDTGEALYGHIMNLAVDPTYRNQGIGTMLVSRTENQLILVGATGIQLEVRRSNKRAQLFYEHLGYQQVFQIAGYYSNGEDAIVMMKWFQF